MRLDLNNFDDENNMDNEFEFEDDFIGISKGSNPEEKKSKNAKKEKAKKNNSKKNVNKIYFRNKDKKNKEKNKKKKEIDYEQTEHFKFKSPYEDAINKLTTKRIIEQEKKKQAKIKRTRIVFAVILGITALILIMLSPIFNVTEITVENNQKVSDNTIISVSGIKLYKNMFMFNKHIASQKIIKSENYIESVKIKRKLPNKVVIDVKERVVAVQIKLSDNSYAYIDNQGYILEFSSEKLNVPVIKGETTDLIDLKSKDGIQRLNENDLNELGLVLKVISIMKDNGIDSYISNFDISEKKDLKLKLNKEQNSKTVYLGDCSSINTRILYLKKILEDTKGEKGEIFINGNLKEDHIYFREDV